MLLRNEFSTKVARNAGLKGLGVSLRLGIEPEANAFRLIKHLQIDVLNFIAKREVV